MNRRLPNKIESLIEDIKQQAFLTSPLLTDMVEDHHLSEDDMASYISYNHASNESYGRQLIYDHGNFKILLMSWRPGDFTAIHNHGYTEWGSVYFLGEATQRMYSVTNDGLEIVRKCSTQRGQIAPVSGDFTHIMGNSSTENFTTLHIYGSNTRKQDVSEGAIVYLPELGKEVTTRGSAYLNMEEQQILSEKPLIKVSSEVMEDYFSLVLPFYERNGLASMLDKVARLNHN